jgi:mitochondrial chaperone BCS1
MDVWVEFKNASKWQAEALFRNFFPSTDDDEISEGDLEGIELPTTPTPSEAAVTTSSSTMFSCGSDTPISTSPSTSSISSMATRVSSAVRARTMSESDSGLDVKSTKAFLPPTSEDEMVDFQHSSPPLDGATLARLAKEFADAIPDDEFSVAALQGCKSLL